MITNIVNRKFLLERIRFYVSRNGLPSALRLHAYGHFRGVHQTKHFTETDQLVPVPLLVHVHQRSNNDRSMGRHKKYK